MDMFSQQLDQLFWHLFPLSTQELCSRINHHANATDAFWKKVTVDEILVWTGLFLLAFDYQHGSKRNLWATPTDEFNVHPDFGK